MVCMGKNTNKARNIKSVIPVIPLTELELMGIMGITVKGGVANGTRELNESNNRA